MSATFSYSLLQYTPSEGSGEVLNVGLLLLFPGERAVFSYPRSLKRLKEAFPDAPDKVLRRFLVGIQDRARKTIWTQPETSLPGSRPQDFIAGHFLIPDASSLRFGEVRQAVRYALSEKIAKDYYNRYLGVYDSLTVEEQHTDEYLAKLYKKHLPDLSKAGSNFRENYQLQSGGNTYSFDFAWNNGKFNMVKAVSFDLKRAETIQRKTERYYGQLNLLKSAVETNNLHFDLLLARPSVRSLYKAYDKSLEILSSVPYSQIWEEEKIKAYSEYTAQSLLAD